MAKKQSVFQDIARQIQEKVDKGIYVSAQRLPSEYDLAKEFEVSRLTVRKAIDELISRNVLVKQKGKGTYVMSQQKIQSGRAGLQGFTEAAKAYGKTSKTEVIDLVLLTASEVPQKIGEALELNPQEEVYHLVRLRSFDNEPMTVEELYIREMYLPNITKEQVEGSVFKLIEEQIEIAYSHQEIAAMLVSDKLSLLLEVPIGEPVLKVNSITYSITATPILYDRSYYRADKYTFKNTLHRSIN